MVNINGTFFSDTESYLTINNRGFNYGDALFETIKVVHGKILFWEDHYFRLMASMRILRMEIPMTFTMEFLESQILETIGKNELDQFTSRIKLSIYRDSEGLYLPTINNIGYFIAAKKIDSDFYGLSEDDYIVDLYKDHYILSGLLSTLKTTNRIINVIGSIYAKENGWDNCILLNENKHVVEMLNGNVFLVNGTTIKTPPLDSGCIKGIMRKQVIEVISAISEYEIKEKEISPFELQKADELFITNVISGIIPINKYRKKTYNRSVSMNILAKLNTKIRLG